jgi:hypothetical protein
MYREGNMRTTSVAVLVTLLVIFAGCVDQPAGPELQSLDNGVQTPGINTAANGQVLNFVTPLDGSQEVPPVDTRARGNAIFHLSKDGAELNYKLIVANLENTLQAHIHCGAFGVNGPVVAFLYPEAPPATLIPGRFSGILAEGTLTNANVIPRPDSDACPGGIANFDEMLAKIMSGDAYVNVHTVANPGGEIRGQFGHGNGMNQ